MPTLASPLNHLAWRRPLILIATAAAALLAYMALPADMDVLARRMVVIFIIAAVFWATEVIPLYATSLCIVGLQVLLLARNGGLADSGDLDYSLFFQPFASPVIILFMGGFLLAAAVTRHGLDRAIASTILQPFTRGPLLLLYGIMGITAFFSMWMSNTATTAMMIAIISPLLRAVGERGRYHMAIIMAVPLGANIGGIGTPIGTPPNAVALAALRQGGYDIGFLDWMIVALPLAVLLIAVAGVLLYYLLGPKNPLTLPSLPKREPISALGKVTLAILLLAIIGWITSRWHGVADAVIALIAAALLTALGVLRRRDVDSIDWDILILMWGGLSLGNAMSATGLIDDIMSLPIADLTGVILAVAVVLLAVGLSTFMSNTAAANLIIPMAMAFSADQRGQLVVLTALASSFAMALPISTPPNAIAFATGRIPASVLLRVGGLVSIISIALLLAGYQIVLPLFLRL